MENMEKESCLHLISESPLCNRELLFLVKNTIVDPMCVDLVNINGKTPYDLAKANPKLLGDAKEKCLRNVPKLDMYFIN